MDSRIFKYWGKADPNYPADPKWHPLVYHNLDVVAVAATWWDASSALQQSFCAALGRDTREVAQARAWVLFFIALHDLGKFDLRFQRKADSALNEAWRDIDLSAIATDESDGFDHGAWGMKWGCKELAAWTEAAEPHIVKDAWYPWLAAVTGHHGDLPSAGDTRCEYAEPEYQNHDRDARAEWVSKAALIFLAPAGLGVGELPPRCDVAAQMLLAGFCAACDWIGSNTEVAPYENIDVTEELRASLTRRMKRVANKKVLSAVGISREASRYCGISSLLKSDESARGVQVLVDDLPAEPSLVLIEAPTGSGKTEAALAHAWRMLTAGKADSIVFALPTQATANAMLTRAEVFADTAFPDSGANVVLAHGKSKFNREFEALVNRASFNTAQGKEEATAQCAGWLAQGRKRVFLGQIGVCTVDQVLLAVLPVRHKFVRGFGLNKAVLIVDEVHAYDAYMHGLLGEVLKRQRAAGGSAILLSATLPAILRSKLFEAWGSTSPCEAPYPAVWSVTSGEAKPLKVPVEQQPEPRSVGLELLKLSGAFPDGALIQRLVGAAESGARVAVVVNLVDDAQRLTRLLRETTNLPVDVFHARYRFVDRQGKEVATIEHYGRDAKRETGRIIVATQVVEQSLDLDFDWLITQICPVDLLFQRIGRLHRHRRLRPPGFELPRCTVMSVEESHYGLFKLIYGNARVLWRTEQMLLAANSILFPKAYRDWIEKVYDDQPWDNEPDDVYGDFLAWRTVQDSSDAKAKQLVSMTMKEFRDDDERATSLTRDGEMSLSVLPVHVDGCLLDGVLPESLDERARPEALSLNVVPVPASWKKRLASYTFDDECRIRLPMLPDTAGSWITEDGKFRYSQDFGLEKEGQ